MSTAILGISAFYHDSAAALLNDGQIIAAAQQERFSRKKHDAGFPGDAIQYCLEEADISLSDVSYIVFYDKPLLKFERLLETYLAFAPKGFKSFVNAMPLWLKHKLYLKKTLRSDLAALSNLPVEQLPALLFSEHHQSHAASAFFPSPFEKAAIICFDGVGEWATTSVWWGENNHLAPRWEVDFPHSLGLLYSAFTYYTGFKVNSGEYKLMGLAPYGEPKYASRILEHLIDVKEDGTFRLDMAYFDFATGLKMTSEKFCALFGGPPRVPESEVTQKEMDLARSIQVVIEDIVLKLARTTHSELSTENLCLAGGVALNCVANGRLQREGPFKNIWIQPAAGDAGGALGAAMAAWHEYLDKPRVPCEGDLMKGAFLGPSFSNDEVRKVLDAFGASYSVCSEDDLVDRVARKVESGHVVGWYQGRMEFGPRALGNRSIIGDARKIEMQSLLNSRIKFRESFRPFAPAVKSESVSEWFRMTGPSPYMLFATFVADDKCLPLREEDRQISGLSKLQVLRSRIPAVTHVDFSARVQTVHQETNPLFHRLIDAFEHLTGCPVVVNTSFNQRGEPIVNTPEDAYRCFMNTDMDFLVLEKFLLAKKDQPDWAEHEDRRIDIELD